MAGNANSKNNNPQKALMDPIYQKFTRGIIRAIGSTDFYEFYMDALTKAQNEFQFSNRKLEKAVDTTWVEAVENALPAVQNIIGNPRNVILEEELIVNAALAKRTNADVVRHLTSHASLVEDFNEKTGDVQPQRVMQKLREDTEVIYENRLVFTTLEMAYHFVKIRYDALFEAMSDEFGAKLKVHSDMESATELVHFDMFMHIKSIESAMDTDERNADVFNRISRIFRLLHTFMNSKFAQQMSKANRIKGNVVKTNVLKKNPDYKKVVALFEFLRAYDQIGYSIRVIEQSPVINETFQRDIFHNVLFNYIILKGYLEDESDRVLPTKPKQKQRTIKPKFIKEIIEELTEDYDLPDVEVRKVLIEELTKEQLMHEEAEERRRLVAEQERQRKEEQERLKKEKEAEKERLRKEKEEEKERIRQEKEAEKQRLFHERMMQEAEDRRRAAIFKKEIERFEDKKIDYLESREKHLEKFLMEKEDFADAAQLLEEIEQRKIEAKERKKRQRQEEKERIRREEEERLEAIRLREEQARREEEERRARLEKEELERRIAVDREKLQYVEAELVFFMNTLPYKKKERNDYNAFLRAEEERRENERRQRQAQRINR
ncbi:MAG: hypothetical protein IJF69_03745 [Clostridia bacterium]|nr:hypothetical protein [Clostridia bacterium]